MVDNVGGSTAANINTATTTVIGATSLDLDDTDDLTTADVGTGVGQVLQFGVAATLPALDGSALTGVTSANFSGALAGDVSGTQGATVVDNVGGSTAANINTATTTVIGATSLDLDDTDDVTDVTNPAAGDIIGNFNTGLNIGAGVIANADLDKANIPLSGFGAATAAIDAGTQVINNVGAPTVASDAATRGYVDGLLSSQDLQTAYDAGGFITTDAGGGPFDVSGTETIGLNATGGGTFSVDGGDLDLITSSSGDINVLPAGSVNLAGPGIATDVQGTLDVAEQTNLNANVNLGISATDVVNVNGDLSVFGDVLGANPLVFQGVTDNAATTTFEVTDPTVSRTITIPDADGTIALEGSISLQSAYDDGPAIVTDATGPFSISGTQPISMAAQGPANFTTTSGNLDLSTFTTGSININSVQDLNLTAGPSNSISLNGQTLFTGNIVGGSPLTFEGNTENANETAFAFVEPTAINTITFPDATGDVLLSSGALSSSLALTTNGSSQIVTADDGQPFSINSNTINLGNGAGDQVVVAGSLSATSNNGGNLLTVNNTNAVAGNAASFTANGSTPAVQINHGSPAQPGLTSSNGIVIGDLASDVLAGAIRFNGGTFEGNIDGTLAGWNDLINVSFPLTATQADPSSLLFLNNTDGTTGSAAIFNSNASSAVLQLNHSLPAEPGLTSSNGIVIGDLASDVLAGAIRFNGGTFEGNIDGTAPGWIELSSTLVNDPGTENLVAGFAAGSSLLAGGVNNTIAGFNAGSGVTDGDDNVLIGRNAAIGITTGSNNVLIGSGTNANAASQNAVAIGSGAQVLADDAVAIGAGTVANTANTIILGDGATSNFNVGIGVQNTQAPLQIGDNFGFGHFENLTNTVDGEFIGNNLYPDYTNATDNDLRRMNTDPSSFMFFQDGNISFHNVAAGAANSAVNLSTGVNGWLDLNDDGTVDMSGFDGELPTDPGSDVRISGGDGNTTGDGGNVFISAGGTGSGTSGRVVSEGNFVIATTGASARSLILEDDDGLEGLSIRAPNALSGNLDWVLPVDNGSGGQVLSNDGGGLLSWVDGGLALPFAATVTENGQALLNLTNDGTNQTARFATVNGTSTATTVVIDSDGTAGSRSLNVVNSGDGTPGEFQIITNVANSNPAIMASTIGTGPAGLFDNLGTGPALELGGDVILFEGVDRSIAIASNTGGAGNALFIDAGSSADGLGGAGGDLEIAAGDGDSGGGGGNGGDVILGAGVGAGAGFDGSIISDGDFIIAGDLTNAKTLYFEDADASESLGFKAPDIMTGASSLVWELPDGDGAANQVLSTDGSGVLSWASAGGFTTPTFDDADNTIFGASATPIAVGVGDAQLGVIVDGPAAGQATLSAISFQSRSQLALIRAEGSESGGAAALGADQVIGDLGFMGHDGVGFSLPQASIRGITTQPWTGPNKGTALTFRSTPFDSNTAEEMMRLEDNVLTVRSNNGQTRTDIISATIPSQVNLTYANGLLTAPTAVIGGETMGQLQFVANYGGLGNYAPGARISADATQTWALNTYGSRLVFSATPNGAPTPVPYLYLEQDGILELASGSGRTLRVQANPSVNGDDFEITAGSASAATFSGGALNLRGGNGNGTGNGGNVRLEPGTGTINGGIDMRGITRFGQPGGASGRIELEDDAGTRIIGITAPTSVPSDYTITLPQFVGTVGQTLVAIDGAGTLDWGSAGDFSVDVNTNYQSISTTLAALTTGNQNILIGSNAGDGITSATDNIVFGRNAGSGLTITADNILVGRNADSNGGIENIAIGRSSTSDGGASVAIGRFTTSLAGGISVGGQSQANDAGTIAIGQVTTIAAGAVNAVAVGDGITVPAAATNAVAIGRASTSSASNAIAIGNTAQASGNNGVAIGNNTNAVLDGTAVGNGATAGAGSTVALGLGASATGSSANSVAIGMNSFVNATNSMAIGAGVNLATANTIALGTANETVLIEGNLVSPPTSLGAAGTLNPTSRVVTVSGGPNVLTINNGIIGKELIIVATGAFTVEDGTGNIRLNASVNYAMGVNDTLHLLFTGSFWLEVGRSDNN
ncbi:MAG: hypothetical protein ABJP45_00645 [Cyclobacteriaceae bacterium]